MELFSTIELRASTYVYVLARIRDATIHISIYCHIVIHWAVISYQYTFRSYRYIEYRDTYINVLTSKLYTYTYMYSIL